MNKPWRGKGSRKLYDLSSLAADPHYFPPITRLGGAWETAGCSPETQCLGLTGGSSAQQKAVLWTSLAGMTAARAMLLPRGRVPRGASGCGH